MQSHAESAPRKSQVFVYADGFMASCEGMVAPRTERYTATLLFATSDEDIEIEVGDRRQRVQIAVLKPFVPKAMHAPNQPFVSIGLNPTHAKFRAYTRMATPGYAAMPRSLFPTLVPKLQALRAGELDAAHARNAYEQCIDAVTQLLPPLRPIDPRIERVTAMLARDHRQPLDALADAACLSYYRMSHLFSHEMGLSLRQYVLSLKIHSAARCIGQGMSLTATAHEAGFTDSAHLSRVWSKAFGGPPSHFLNQRTYAIKTGITRRQSMAKAA
ncbi:MAG: AraC family transcriptional regulator [Rhizobacter sp.]